MAFKLMPYHKRAARELVLGVSEKDVVEHLSGYNFKVNDIRRWRGYYEFRQYMATFESELDQTVLDFLGTLRRECYERLHDMLQSSNMDDWKWAISQVLDGGSSGLGDQSSRGVVVNNYVESPEAKEHGKRYLESLRQKPARTIPPVQLAEA